MLISTYMHRSIPSCAAAACAGGAPACRSPFFFLPPFHHWRILVLSLVTRKISGHSFALALAAALLNSGTASAADVANDAQIQARALLTGVSVSRTDHAFTSFPATDATATSAEAQDLARRLLAGKPGYSDAERGPDQRDSRASRISVQDQDMAYAGAQASARKMILGKGA
jgi:hypothetical protein